MSKKLFSLKRVKTEAETACKRVGKASRVIATFSLTKLPDRTYRVKVKVGELESVTYPVDLYTAHSYLQYEISRLGALND